MKIKGSSKIISEKLQKEQDEALVSVAEVSDLLYEEVPQGKIGKAKQIAKNLFDQTKPFREQQKLLAGQAIKKAREMSPYVDKTITVMDKSIKYLTVPVDMEGRSEVIQETRSPSVFGIWVLIVTFGFFMMWGFLAPLDSASHAIGKIVLESKKRIIQHPEGGVIKAILVRDGDQVIKGQTLILLDDTKLQAQEKQQEYKYFATLAEVSRLIAERDNIPDLIFPEPLLNNSGDPEVQSMIENQQKLFTAKKLSIASKIAHAQKNTEQLIESKNAILPQIESLDKLIKINTEQANTYQKLFAKGNLNKNTLQEVESAKAQNEGRKGALMAQLAETEHKILQSQIALENEADARFEKTVSELKEAQAQLSIYNEALKDINESLSRTIITSPEAGIVSNMYDKLTPRGVLPQQHPLMEIVPQDDNLIIEAKVKSDDISVVRIGQTANVRLTAYRPRVVPPLQGTVVSISSDAIVADQLELQTQVPQLYYKVRIEINKEHLKELAKIKNVSLYPGMIVDVMIVVGTRTMMEYLFDPLIITLNHAFREK